MKYCLAIDIGASSGRHILGCIDDGKMVLEEIYRFSNGPTEKNGRLVWDIKRIFNEIKNGIKKAKEIGKIPETIAIDTWGVDYALLDKDDKLIGDLVCYRDERTNYSSKEVEKIVPFEILYKKTGIEFAVFNSVYQLYDDVLSGKMKDAETLLMLPDYLNFLLTGVKKQEYTNSTTTALVNVETHEWDYEIIEKLSIKKSLFGKLSQPSEIVGTLSEEIEKEVGYSATVVLPATHDTASAVLAVPDSGKQGLYISSGTWSLMGVEVPKAITNERYDGKLFSNEGSLNFNFRFQTNIMGMWIFQNVKKEIGGEMSFAELTKLAESSKWESVFNVNDERFFAPKSMVTEIKGYFKERNVNPPENLGDICRSIFLSLADYYAKTIKAFKNITKRDFDTLHIIGGGSQNNLLNKLTANLTGLKVVAGPTEASAIGNVMMQLVALKVISSVNEGKEIIKKSFEIKEII